MKSYFNEYLESEMNAIKLQGEIDSIAIALKYVLRIITDEQADAAKSFIEMVSISDKTKTTIYDSRFTENRKD